MSPPPARTNPGPRNPERRASAQRPTATAYGGHRWPWLLPAALLGAVLLVLWLLAAFTQVIFEPTRNELYTAWVSRPLFIGYGVALLACVTGLLLLTLRRWNQRARAAILAATVIVTAGASTGGLASSHPRRNIAPHLLRAAAQVPAPPAAAVIAPLSLESDGTPGGTLAAPRALAAWQSPDGTKRGACAAIRALTQSQPGWRAANADCLYQRVVGQVRLTLFVGPVPGGGAVDVIQLMAEPAVW